MGIGFNSLDPIAQIGLICLVAGLTAVGAALLFRVRFTQISWPGGILSVVPSALQLVLFYSLAIHMHWALGRWPESISERGFPNALVHHAHLATSYFIAWVLISMATWPIAFLAFLLVKPARQFLLHLGLYALAFAGCYGLMLLAPERFLYWWWD